MCEYDVYRDWSVKNILASTVLGVKQIALDSNLTIPEAINECLIAYESLQEPGDSE